MEGGIALCIRHVCNKRPNGSQEGVGAVGVLRILFTQPGRPAEDGYADRRACAAWRQQPAGVDWADIDRRVLAEYLDRVSPLGGGAALQRRAVCNRWKGFFVSFFLFAFGLRPASLSVCVREALLANSNRIRAFEDRGDVDVGAYGWMTCLSCWSGNKQHGC